MMNYFRDMGKDARAYKTAAGFIRRAACQRSRARHFIGTGENGYSAE
jgi:hypothetical protein